MGVIDVACTSSILFARYAHYADVFMLLHSTHKKKKITTRKNKKKKTSEIVTLRWTVVTLLITAAPYNLISTSFDSISESYQPNYFKSCKQDCEFMFKLRLYEIRIFKLIRKNRIGGT